jgi:transcriptional regulator with XRE-family HTH domain
VAVICALEKLTVIKESEILRKFGERVRELRKQLSISQEELAQRANLHRTYIGMIERAEKNITLLNIQKIASALNKSISELLKF